MLMPRSRVRLSSTQAAFALADGSRSRCAAIASSAVQTYICYVHTRDAFLPNVRLVDADSMRGASALLISALRDWPRLLSVEVLEIFDESQASLFRVRVDRMAPTH
jgi:hypothetical protein